eukprot:765021-Hanusia_phi.AAC.2
MFAHVCERYFSLESSLYFSVTCSTPTTSIMIMPRSGENTCSNLRLVLVDCCEMIHRQQSSCKSA